MFTDLTIKFLSQIISFLQMNGIVTFIIFVIAIFVLYRLIKFTVRILTIVIIGMAFPFIMNYFFNWGISTDLNTLIFYATTAVAIYLFALFVKGILKFLGIILSPLKKRRYERSIEKNVEKDIQKKIGLSRIRKKKKDKI
ncbi:MAG: hypothetical protein J7L45_03040 [Candidatus Aenigmarchaeota archaeon]|nr:hypothetical protein [Candidatus Aenigmarchaeota archaeon]